MEEFKANLIFNETQPLEAYVTEKDGNSYPVSLDMRDLVLRTEDQGMRPECAAYTCTSWIESIMWRRTGKPVNYDPQQLYKKAKTLDGMPDSPGTTLPAVLQAAISLNWLPGYNQNDIRLIYNSNQLKRAIHRYGTCLLGFAITDTWYKHIDKLVLENYLGNPQGGHAVICTGYNNIGVFIQNSWGEKWGKYGFALIPWEAFNCQFRTGAYIKNCLSNLE